MKSLAIDEKTGDLVIENNEIQLVDGDELLRQKIREIINTNQGEWCFDWEQGIEFDNLLGKHIEEEVVRTEIEQGVQQVDDDLIVSNFNMEVVGRTLKVNFTVSKTESNTELDILTEF